MAEAARHDDRPRTIEEWADLDEDEPGELVDGHLVEEELAGWGHEVVVAWLLAVLHGWARGAGARVVASELKMAVSSTRGRKADLVVHLAGDPRPPRRGAARSAFRLRSRSRSSRRARPTRVGTGSRSSQTTRPSESASIGWSILSSGRSSSSSAVRPGGTCARWERALA